MTRRLLIGDLAKASGVSVRTLRHYDEIGLLSPAFVGENGYRYYGRDEFLRLQQIMLHRELEIPLKEIAALLARRTGYSALLREQRDKLSAEATRYRRLVATIDRTIAELEGSGPMMPKDLYKGFSKEKQEEHEAWLVEKYGGDTKTRIADSRRKFDQLTPAERAARMRELHDVETALAAAMTGGTPAQSAANAPLLERHRSWIASMWGRPCPPAAYAGLADLYLSHPDFRTRYDAIAEGFAEYLAAAMKAHAKRQA